jgi:TetR/AcrR family transcriptional regulator, regulator of cefoperazone and chloramphenicol sensitivity
MARDATDTREKLIRAAEHLFARSGLDVPIREIHERAGQKNASAIQYHFGSKQELINAILERQALSDAELAAVRADLRSRRHDAPSLVDAIVRRIAGYLGSEEARDYVRIAFQLLVSSPLRKDLDAGVDRPDLISFEAEVDLIRSAVPHLSQRVLNERALAGLTFVTLQVAERARIIDDEPDEPLLDEEEFITNLVDMTAALLTAPAGLPAGVG